MAHGTLYVLWDVLLRGETATEHLKECEESKTKHDARQLIRLQALYDGIRAPYALLDEEHLVGCRLVCIYPHASTAFDEVRPGTKPFYRDLVMRGEDFDEFNPALQ
ncbi:hypothetical protein PISMIDRAFT_17172 [Pisolithus microcarpus 441]|uniref:Uncharacterized protein n=1 Tax=Pisolithus microcarpus 441 TaxID=765257 RepID=A0A0C9YLA6_9AGAM|nr:hypothetical protein BKA83DRAFT_17172 [Pisolithus microcarpus]KIK14609.1 hypothetical protein PISMIDRAFT_17172 [Pisolithus microcarpus 441]